MIVNGKPWLVDDGLSARWPLYTRGNVGEAVHANPLDRFIGTVTFSHGLQVAGGIEKHRMAIHAGFRGRNACKGGIPWASGLPYYPRSWC